jgi:hypothetical protein
MRNSSSLPSRDRLGALSRLFGVPLESWVLAPSEFAEALDQARPALTIATETESVSVSLPAIESHRHLWRRCFDIHRGQYIAFWKAFGQEATYVASLLEIKEIGASGISFSLINPYVRDDVDHDEVRCWRYEGKLYPVAEYLYFFCQEVDSNYELTSMIMTASPIAPPDLLRGCMSGIYVKDGRKQIAVNIAIVLMFTKKPLVDWRREIGERLGKLPAGKVPERIKRLLDPFPGVIPLS